VTVLGERLRRVGGVAIAVIAIMRCAIVFTPQRVFDVDPTLSDAPLGGLGPAGSLALDAAMLLACALALAGEALAGRGVRLRWLVLALLPVPAIAWHASEDAGDLWRGVTWLAAMTAAVTLAHLARDERLRATLGALLLAVIAPLLVRGLWQVTQEHAATVHEFERNREQILGQFGWEPGSAAALIYERRLRQPQPTGWFATTNVLATVLAGGLVALLGLAHASWRERLSGGRAAVCLAVAAACAAGIALGGAKGAVMAVAAGLMLLALPLAMPRWPMLPGWCGRAAFVIALAAVSLAVLVRGTLLPEAFAGDKSLLFRWHYMVAAGRIISDHPWLGVGPDGFQQAYVAARPLRNPEEVTSAHHVLLDWLSALGASGLAWTAVLLGFTWRAGQWRGGVPPQPAATTPRPGALRTTGRSGRPRMTESPRPDPGPPVRLPAAPIVAVIGLLAALLFERHALGIDAALVRLAGIAAFAGLSPAITPLIRAASPDALRWALAAGSITMLMHGQIEMTLTQLGSAAWVVAVLALAAPVGEGRGGAIRMRAGLGCAAAVAVVAALLPARHVIPAWRQEQRMLAAAAMIGRASAARENLHDARQAAAQSLETAHELWPINPAPLQAAASQWIMAATPGDAAALDNLRHAEQAARRSWNLHGRLASLSLLAQAQQRIAQQTAHRDDWDAAIASYRELARRDGAGLVSHLRLADALWASGEHQDAAAVYQRVLDIDRALDLDELKRLPPRDRQQITARLGEVAGQRPADPLENDS
jgi:hypothetical protein